jgi:adenylate cyclase
MVTLIEDAGGMIDKFLGDGFMAIFGAPSRLDGHARCALEASVSIQQAHLKWIEERTASGRPNRPMGIGVATGETVVGAYGTRNRMDYTVLGNVVNLASRLCAAAAGGEILTIAETIEKAGFSYPETDKNCAGLPFVSKTKGKLLFKNIPTPVEVFSIFKQ